MDKSIAKNSVFYMIYNVLNMLFPFITNVYVSHVLLPVSIGEVAYAQNVVNYFSIMAFLGIPTYGLREIAKARGDRKELDKLFSELFIINLISTVIFSVAYYGMILVVPAFREKMELYAIVGLTVAFNSLNISWLFSGLEEYQYVSIRNAVFKGATFVLLVFCVRGDTDILKYAAISVIGAAGNDVFNMVYRRRFVSFDFCNLNLKRHMHSIMMLVLVNIAIEIYTLVDTTMLGMMTTKDHVAFYSYASRVNKILIQITSTVTCVLVPRISVYYKEGKLDEFNELLTKGLKVILMLSIPIIIGIQFTGDFLFSHVFGESYIRSAQVERLLCLVLTISPIGYLLGSRVMLVSDNEKKMTLAVSIGAVVNIILNYILIQQFDEFGAALASVISEVIVMVVYVNFGRKVFKLHSWIPATLTYVGGGIAELLFLLVCNSFIDYSWTRLIIEILGSAVCYIGILWLLKDKFVRDCIEGIVGRIRKKKA